MEIALRGSASKRFAATARLLTRCQGSSHNVYMVDTRLLQMALLALRQLTHVPEAYCEPRLAGWPQEW
jgi:hypothetical protein